jgi:hypothetical protein
VANDTISLTLAKVVLVKAAWLRLTAPTRPALTIEAS